MNQEEKSIVNRMIAEEFALLVEEGVGARQAYLVALDRAAKMLEMPALRLADELAKPDEPEPEKPKRKRSPARSRSYSKMRKDGTWGNISEGIREWIKDCPPGGKAERLFTDPAKLRSWQPTVSSVVRAHFKDWLAEDGHRTWRTYTERVKGGTLLVFEREAK